MQNENKTNTAVPARQPPRYKAQVEMIERAMQGDPAAVKDVFQYLGTSNANLRHMIQSAMHDSADARVWRQMLHCLAYECWLEPTEAEEGAEGKATPAQRAVLTLQNAHTQTLTEIFVLDENQSEKSLKEAVLNECLFTEDEKLRWAAIYIKGLRGDLMMATRLDELIERGDLAWKMRAIQALSVLDDPLCGPALVKALAMDHDVLHRAARLALSDMGRKAEPALVEALHHPDSHIRWHAARDLGQLGDPRAVEVLAEGLYDDNQSVRWATARVLANLDIYAVPAVLRVLSSHPINEPFRQAAYHALHAMHSAQTQQYLKPLVEALHNPGADVHAPLIAQRMLADWHK
jgi:HEAT repeat protein